MAQSFLSAEDTQKRRYVEILLSNTLIKRKKIQQIQYKMPYQIIANLPKNADFDELCVGQDSNLRRRCQRIYSPPSLTT
jgi:hypothetical protein